MWYRDLFCGKPGQYWVEWYFSKRYQEYTSKEVAFLEDALKGDAILELCCGPGRHSIPLSSSKRVVGFDLSRYFLSVLKEGAVKSGSKNLDLVNGDMRALPFKLDYFDAVVNLQKSFGYFSDEENVSVLGNGEPTVLPISEIVFKSQDEPKIVDYAAKWLKESDNMLKLGLCVQLNWTLN